MTYNVNSKITTNNTPVTASPAKDAASKNIASKPSGFGSSAKRFGGKKTRKQQKGGDPATIGLFAVFGAFYLFSCVWGFYKDKFISKFICASPAIALGTIPFIIYDTLRNKEPTPGTNEVPEGATTTTTATTNTATNTATIIEASPFNTRMNYGGRKSRRTKTRKQKSRRTKK
jgi:hypothetical protein